jgi:heat shock protein HslJ
MPARACFILVATVLLSTGCTPLARVSHPTSPAGTTWRVLSVQGRLVPAGQDVTIAFDSDQVSGNGGCNSFGGQFTYEPATGSFRVSRRATTLRACVDPVRNDLESAYVQALDGATVANIDPAGHVVLTGPGAELVLEVGPSQGGVPIEASPGVSTAP